MKHALTLLALTLVTLAGCAKNVATTINEKENGYKYITSGTLTFAWKVEGDLLSCTVVAETKGWIAVGFHPTSVMKDANIIIGCVKDGEAVVNDEFAKGRFSHEADTDLGGKNNVTDVTGKEFEKDGKTYTSLAFTIPLDSKDEYDRAVTEGEPCPVIFAYAEKDDMNAKHSTYYKTEITF